jgi:hypothetical protein
MEPELEICAVLIFRHITILASTQYFIRVAHKKQQCKKKKKERNNNAFPHLTHDY